MKVARRMVVARLVSHKVHANRSAESKTIKVPPGALNDIGDRFDKNKLFIDTDGTRRVCKPVPY